MRYDPLRWMLIGFLRAYRLLISPLYGQVCRYHPTCSAYALEAVTQYKLLRHGEAVAYGMKAASAIAVARGTWTEAEHGTLVRLLDHMGPLPAIGGLDAEAVIAATRRDKKVVAGTLHFVLPTRIGETTIATDVDETQVRESLAAIGISGQ